MLFPYVSVVDTFRLNADERFAFSVMPHCSAASKRKAGKKIARALCTNEVELKQEASVSNNDVIR